MRGAALALAGVAALALVAMGGGCDPDDGSYGYPTGQAPAASEPDADVEASANADDAALDSADASATPPVPPRAAADACQGAAPESPCSFEAESGETVTGRCRPVEGPAPLACVP